MRELLTEILECGVQYIDGRDERRVSPSKEAVQRLAILDEPLPESPTDPRAILRMIDEIGSPATVMSSGGRYFGFVMGGTLPAALAANLMAGIWDQNAGLRVQSPIAAMDRRRLSSLVNRDFWIARGRRRWIRYRSDGGQFHWPRRRKARCFAQSGMECGRGRPVRSSPDPRRGRR